HDIFMQELFLLDEFHGMTKENMDVVASFLASAFIGMLTHWVERGMRVHMSDYCECLEVLFKGSAMQKMFFPNGEEAEACGC
ncbi:MAG: TetR-like C-terminal domain-containing protein, partial [Gemmiger sp.]